MINLFKKLFCLHDWKQISSRKCITLAEYSDDIVAVKYRGTFICKKCGKFIRKQI